jgi:hypothetical protein
VSRRGPLLLLLCLCSSLALAGAAARPAAAAFTRATAVTGNQVTVDRLANYFSATPGAAVQPGTSTPVSSGNVDTLALAFGAVPSARTFTSVFTVANVSAQSQTAVLTLLSGAPQIASAAFASSGTASATLAAGAQTTVTIVTSSTVAGRGVGTLRLGLSGVGWLYRDYALTIDESPEAAPSLTATARAGGRIALAWGASTTTTNLAGYDVYRAVGAGAPTKLTATPQAALAYTDAATADGTVYTYKIAAVSSGTPTLTSLDSPTAAATADATAPAQPASTSVTSGGGWINGGTKTSVSVAVTLLAGSIASDTVTVTLATGAQSVSKTVGASAGAGTVTVSGIDASTLAEGAVTIGATSTDLAGNVSTVRTGSVTKDTVAPAAPTTTYVDTSSADSVTGSAEAGAAIRATRTAPSAAGPFTATAAAGGSYTVTVSTVRSVTVTYSVTATDAAGNVSSAATVTSADTR